MATDMTTKTSRIWFVADFKSPRLRILTFFCILLKFNSLTIVFVLCHIANPLETAISLIKKIFYLG
jgi:hypothetical protein